MFQVRDNSSEFTETRERERVIVLSILRIWTGMLRSLSWPPHPELQCTMPRCMSSSRLAMHDPHLPFFRSQFHTNSIWQYFSPEVNWAHNSFSALEMTRMITFSRGEMFDWLHNNYSLANFWETLSMIQQKIMSNWILCLISDKSFGWAGGLPAPPTADISPNITAINFPVNQHIAALLHGGMSLSTLVYTHINMLQFFPKVKWEQGLKNLTYFSPCSLLKKLKSELEL